MNSDQETIKQYRFLLEQIATLSNKAESLDEERCASHLLAINKLCKEALAMDGT